MSGSPAEEARRSRTVARLIREAYKLVDRTDGIDEVGALMLDIIVNNTICDRAAFLHRTSRDDFTVTHAIGFGDERPPTALVLPAAPLFFYTSSQTRKESPADELTRLLRLPYILWAFDAGSAHHDAAFPVDGHGLLAEAELAAGQRTELQIGRVPGVHIGRQRDTVVGGPGFLAEHHDPPRRVTEDLDEPVAHHAVTDHDQGLGHRTNLLRPVMLTGRRVIPRSAIFRGC